VSTCTEGALGLVRYLLSRFNPTWTWEENPFQPLVVNLDSHRFCAVAVDDPAEALAFLGPGKNTNFGFVWPHKGIEVSVSIGEERITEMGFYFGHADEAAKGVFPGEFRYRGAVLRLSGESKEADIHSVFGQPYWRNQDESEILLFYEFPKSELQVELGLDGFLKYLRFGGPVLADAEQRRLYGVTKVWPPAYS
jgi:hypothetical protein